MARLWREDKRIQNAECKTQNYLRAEDRRKKDEVRGKGGEESAVRLTKSVSSRLFLRVSAPLREI